MAKAKFKIQVIEEGRLSESEMSNIMGGASDTCNEQNFKATCGILSVSLCAMKTVCRPDSQGTGYNNCPSTDKYQICTQIYDGKEPCPSYQP